MQGGLVQSLRVVTPNAPEMTQATLHAEHSAVRKLCVALELGGTRWKLAASSGGLKITETGVAAGMLKGWGKPS
jgi:hypothetical protein